MLLRPGTRLRPIGRVRGMSGASAWTPADGMPGALAVYPMNDGSGDTVTDVFGGLNGTRGIAGLAQYKPAWHGGGLLFDGGDTVLLPVAAGTSLKCIDMVVEVGPQSADQSQFLFCHFNSGGHYPMIAATDSRPVVGYDANATAFLSSAVRLENSVARLTFVDLGAGVGKVYVDGVEVSRYLIADSAQWPGLGDGSTPAQVAIGSFFNAAYGFRNHFYHLALYTSAPSASQVRGGQSYYTALMAERSVTLGAVRTPAATRRVVCVGTSITARLSDNGGGGWPGRLQAGLTTGAKVTNLGVGGNSSSLLLSRDVPTAITQIGTSGQDVAVVEIGTNDGFSPASLTNATAACDALIAGGFWRVGMVTGLPRTGTDSARATFNADLATYVAGKAGAFLIDWAADATMGPNGANTDGTYYSDTVHPTAAGFDILGAICVTRVNAQG